MSREEECKGAPSLSFLFKKETVENPPVQLPIIVPMSGIKRFQIPNGNLVKLQPKGKQLKGFRCKDILQSGVISEQCGSYEPMGWLGKLYFTIREKDFDTGMFVGYPRGFTGEIKPQPIDCIALFPSEQGYILLGGWPTRFSCRRPSRNGSLYDDCIIAELSAYQPFVTLHYDGSVVVTDCTVPEMMGMLKNLIR